MGREVEEHVRFLVNDDRRCRCGHPLTYQALECQVKKAYSHQVNHRMLNNGIKYVEGFNPYQGHSLPQCMMETQKMIIKKIMKEENTTAEEMHSQYIKCIKEYNSPPKKKAKEEEIEVDDDLPDLKNRDSIDDEDTFEEENNLINSRTAVEQKADISPSFKLMKLHLQKQNEYDKTNN
jgi:hypothetical protein